MKEHIIGTWILHSFEQISLNTNKKSFPFGESPVGYLIYTIDGTMSINIMAKGRKTFKINDIMSGDNEEIISAYKTFTSYAGEYEIIDDIIKHKIKTASFPNYINTEHIRHRKWKYFNNGNSKNFC